MTQGRTQKHKSKEKTLQQQKQHEKQQHSSKPTGVPALIEHRLQDGWTSTPCVSDDIRKNREYDETAGERLAEQRPHSIDKKIKMKQEHKKSKEEARRANTRRRGVSALIEHKRQDDWTFTPCTRGRSGCSGGCDVLAGERLPKQRPQGEEHPDHKTEEHLGARFPHQGEEAGSIVFHSSSNTSEIENDNNGARVMASAAAKVSEDFPNKDAEILRLIEEKEKYTQRRETTTERSGQVHKKCVSREKKNEKTIRHPKNS